MSDTEFGRVAEEENYFDEYGRILFVLFDEFGFIVTDPPIVPPVSVTIVQVPRRARH